MSTQRKVKYDTATRWSNRNPLLETGVIGVEKDTGLFKIGDGNTKWSSLSYVNDKLLDENGNVAFDVDSSGDVDANDNTIKNLFSLILNNSSGWLKMENDGTVWKDINLGGVSLTKAASNQPDLVSIDGTNILGYAFDGGGNLEELHGAFELQHDYAEGTDIKPHLHWYPTTSGSGDAKWSLEYWISVEGTTVENSTTSVVSSAPGTAWEQVWTNFDSVISGTNLKIASQIHFRFYRDSSDAADTYTDDAVLGTVGIHYELSSIGSRQDVTK